MQNLGTDRTCKKASISTRNPLQLMQPIKLKNIILPQSNPVTQQRKKNSNLQSITFLRNEIAILEKKQTHKENRVLDQRQLVCLKEAHLEIVNGKVPFANATNTKPQKSYSIKPVKSKTEHQRELSQKVQIEQKNSPKLNKGSKEFCEKLCQQKLIGVNDTKKKSNTYRIHLSSSKDKQNHTHTHNRVNSISEQRQVVVVENLQPSQQKSQSFPAIDEDLTKRLTSNREKSTHSFMIRKKINSTMLQSSQQRNGNKDTNKSVQWSKCYRKDKFTKEEELQVSATPKLVQERAQAEIQRKTQGRQEIAQQRMSEQSQKSIKRIDAIKAGKSLKMRKNKFSKPQESQFIYEEIVTQPNGNIKFPEEESKKFHNTFEDNFKLNKVNTVEYEKVKMKELQSVYTAKNQQCELKNVQLQDMQAQLCQFNQMYDLAHQYLPIESLQNQLIFPPQQSQIIVSKQIKVEKRRVSSIRALKNLFRSSETEQKSELTESRNVQLSKKKEKEAPCLTHKIKWGNQTKRKQSLQKITDLIQPIVIEINNDRNVKVGSEEKNKKKARFADEQIESSPKESQVIDKKGSTENFFREQTSKPYQSIGSRSMILFDDPGISVIVNKNSSMQSSAHVYTTIENEIQKSEIDYIQENDKPQFSSKKKRQSKNYDNPRLESLKELFLELQSHKSIEIEEH